MNTMKDDAQWSNFNAYMGLLESQAAERQTVEYLNLFKTGREH